jgi:hypothetical protein
MLSFWRLLALSALALPLSAAAAKETQPAVPDVVRTMLACKNEAADAKRLACYDRAASAFDSAVAQRDVTIVDKQEVRRTRRSLFGYALPNLALLGVDDKNDKEAAAEAETLDSTIQSVRSVSYGKWDMVLEEQAVWRNVDLIDVAPRKGDKVHIKKAALGSYFMKIGSARTIRANRVR